DYVNSKHRGPLPAVHLSDLKKIGKPKVILTEGESSAVRRQRKKRTRVSMGIVWPSVEEVAIVHPFIALRDEDTSDGTGFELYVVSVSSSTELEDLEQISKIARRMKEVADLLTFLTIGGSKRKGPLASLS
ncbi:hypothetical protein U1Q18_046164, partial [Sarracenia purpurea var. burkii]